MQPDAFKSCEQFDANGDSVCTHDTAAAVLVTDLRKREGPWPNSNPLMSTGPIAVGILAALRRDFPQRTTNG